MRLRGCAGLVAVALLVACAAPRPTAAVPTPAPTPPATAGPTTAPAPDQAAAPTAAPSPAAATATPLGPTAFRVGNTGGDGAFIRRAPGLAPEGRLRAWPDGTRLVALGERVVADGHAWEKVRDPDGAVGYVAGDFLVADAPKPAGAGGQAPPPVA